jgi:hypothetical protein
MHENRAMKLIFGPKRAKATASWGKLHVVMRAFVVDLVFYVWEVNLLLEERQLSGRRIFRGEDKLKTYFKESVRDLKFSQ